MKMRMIVLLPFLLAPLASAQTNTTSAPGSNTHALSVLMTKLDTDYGFRDLKLEQPIESCKGMVLIEDDPVIKFYNRPDDKLEFNGAKLKSIEYGFYKGKLFTIMITSLPNPDGSKLLEAMQADYGPPTKTPRNPNKFYWWGLRVSVDFVINEKGVASVGFWSKPLQEQRALDAKAAKP